MYRRKWLRGRVNSPKTLSRSSIKFYLGGAGNVIALDVLRALNRSPNTMESFLVEISELGGGHPEINKNLEMLKKLPSEQIEEVNARRLVELMAKLWSSALLIGRGEQIVAEAYISSRLCNDWGNQFGSLPQI